MSNWFESLNAPFGAWCFLTLPVFPSPTKAGLCLNAPFGAWCFLTLIAAGASKSPLWRVLMHLLALGAF